MPAQGKRADIKKMKDSILHDPKVPLHLLIEEHGHCAVFLNVIKELRAVRAPKRDWHVKHEGL